MKRIVVLGQRGAFGRSACSYVAERLGQRLDLPQLTGRDAELSLQARFDRGWIAVEAAGAVSLTLFAAADTAIWLHYSALAVAREWARNLRLKFSGLAPCSRSPRLADLGGSLQHMAWTPHLHRWLQHPSLAHLHVFHLRSPSETDFWLHAQEHRFTPLSAATQPA